MLSAMNEGTGGVCRNGPNEPRRQYKNFSEPMTTDTIIDSTLTEIVFY